MTIPFYQPADMTIWTGRIDDPNLYEAFRFHQWVEPLNLDTNKCIVTQNVFAIAFLGFISDQGIERNLGRTGARNGPSAIRKELRNKPCHFSKELKLYDAGDIVAQGCELSEAQEALSLAVEKLLNSGFFPILMGGGHEIAYGHYKGIERYLCAKKVKGLSIVNFDAHFDLRPYPQGGSSGTMFKQIADDCAIKNLPFHYFCIGIQKSGNTNALFKSAELLKVQHLLAVNLSEASTEIPMQQLNRFIEDKPFVYTTICMDVFSSAFAPGVSSAQPLGMNPERVLIYLKHLVRTGKLISFDIAEVSPRFDLDNSTANLASIVIFALITTLAEVKGLEYVD